MGGSSGREISRTGSHMHNLPSGQKAIREKSYGQRKACKTTIRGSVPSVQTVRIIQQLRTSERPSRLPLGMA